MTYYELAFPESFLDPSITMDSGQAFRWTPTDKNRRFWIGIVSGKIMRVSRNRVQILSGQQDAELLQRYFSIEDDLDSIFSTFPEDDILDLSRKQFRGLRLLTQDPWECLISFVCSINCNIPSIRLKIENMSLKFGEKIHTDLDLHVYSFPRPQVLARASKRDLIGCKLGFRWKYIKFIAERVASGELDLETLRNRSYHDALIELISDASGKTFGVGPKVADCALLYSIHKTEAFPIDVWILRCLERFYHDEIRTANIKSLTSKRYFEISEAMRKKFGKYSGYAQLYLYVKMREDSKL